MQTVEKHSWERQKEGRKRNLASKSFILKASGREEKNAACMEHGGDSAKDEEVFAGYRASSWGRGS